MNKKGETSMERIGQALDRAWYHYCQFAGIVLLASVFSYAVLEIFSYNGPVVEVTDGPHLITKSIPYMGDMHYKLSTRRNASCPGTSIIQFTSLDAPLVSVVITRPIMLPVIQENKDVHVVMELPRSVFAGGWTYQLTVDSRCPTYTRQDVIARFIINVEEQKSAD